MTSASISRKSVIFKRAVETLESRGNDPSFVEGIETLCLVQETMETIYPVIATTSSKVFEGAAERVMHLNRVLEKELGNSCEFMGFDRSALSLRTRLGFVALALTDLIHQTENHDKLSDLKTSLGVLIGSVEGLDLEVPLSVYLKRYEEVQPIVEMGLLSDKSFGFSQIVISVSEGLKAIDPVKFNRSLVSRKVSSGSKIVISRDLIQAGHLLSGLKEEAVNSFHRNEVDDLPGSTLSNLPFSLGEDVGLGPYFQFVTVTPGKLYYDWGQKNYSPHIFLIEKSFEIQTTVLTQGVYKKITGKNPSKYKGDRFPVTHLSYYDILEVLALLNRWTEKRCHYSIPSRTEWDLAIGGPGWRKQGQYFFVDSIHALKEFAWFDSDAQIGFQRVGLKKPNTQIGPQPVGLKKPNRIGIYDPLGNVRQMILNCYSVSEGVCEPNPKFNDDYSKVLKSISTLGPQQEVFVEKEIELSAQNEVLYFAGGEIQSSEVELRSLASYTVSVKDLNQTDNLGLRLVRTCKDE